MDCPHLETGSAVLRRRIEALHGGISRSGWAVSSSAYLHSAVGRAAAEKGRIGTVAGGIGAMQANRTTGYAVNAQTRHIGWKVIPGKLPIFSQTAWQCPASSGLTGHALGKQHSQQSRLAHLYSTLYQPRLVSSCTATSSTSALSCHTCATLSPPLPALSSSASSSTSSTRSIHNSSVSNRNGGACPQPPPRLVPGSLRAAPRLRCAAVAAVAAPRRSAVATAATGSSSAGGMEAGTWGAGASAVVKTLSVRSSSDIETTPLLLRSNQSYSGGQQQQQQQNKQLPRAGSDVEPPKGGGSSDGNGFDGWKYLVALCAVSVVICYADRSNISTAILSMSEQFGWDKAYQGVILSTFFIGYASTQVLGGRLADKYGGKLVLAVAVSVWSFFTGLIPHAAAWGAAPLLATRVMLGVGEGVAFPAIHSLIARNVPYASQSTAVGIVTAASYMGTALAFGVSPHIITTYGWEWVFYLFAGLAVLWLPLWLPVHEKRSPASSSEVAGNGSAGSSASAVAAVAAAAPGAKADGSSGSSSLASAGSAASNGQQRGFWALMRRKEVWAICIAQYTGSWGLYGLLNWLPTFFSEFYHIELADLGSYTLLPYIVQGALGALTGIVADRMLSNGWKIRNVRVLLQVAGMLGPAVCLLAAVSPVVGASASTASNLITLGLGFSALTLGGVSVSHLDIAPRHAGVVFGAGNTAATIAGLISVPATGFVLQATQSWPIVFGITAAHYVVGAIAWAAWVGDSPLPEDAEEENGGQPPLPASKTSAAPANITL